VSALSLLARVIRTTERAEVHEVHAYALHHAIDIATELDMPLPAYLDMVDEQILAALPARLTAEMSTARRGRRDKRVAAMQRAADACAATWTYDGEIDLAPLLAGLAPSVAWIVVGPDTTHPALPCAVLRRFHAARRSVPRGWTARLVPDRLRAAESVLEIRWTAAGRRGGLNVRATVQGRARLQGEGAVYLVRPTRAIDCAAE
jgi:hypothetical protein